MFDYDTLLYRLYNEGLGRTPDAEGLNYWRNEAGKFQQGNTQTLTPGLIAAFHGGSKYGQPDDYQNFTGFREWEGHNATARQQTDAINNMPGVYNYGPMEYYSDDEMTGIYDNLKKRVGGLGGLGGVDKK